MTAANPPAEGTLSQMSLPDLLSGHASARSSGRLLIRTSVGEAEVRLSEGSVSDARFGPADGEAAMMRLLAFTEGTFQFEARTQSMPGSGANAMGELLQKAQAHQADVLHHAEKLGGLQERYALDLGQLSKLEADIRREIGPVLGLIDGRRTLQELVASSEMPDVTVLRVLRKLRTMGLLRSSAEQEADRRAKEAPPTPAAPAEPPKPKTLEEMLLAQAATREQERRSVLEMAVPAASTAAERLARTAAAEAFAASEPAVTAPPERKRTPPAGVPVAATTVLPQVPGRPNRDEIKLKKSTLVDPPTPATVRWTDRPSPRVEEPTGDDGLEYALDRRSSPVAAAGPHGHPTPLVNRRVDAEPGAGSVMAAAVVPAATAPLGGAMPELAPTPLLTPRRSQPEPPKPQAHDPHDDAFFERGADQGQLEALAEEAAAAERDNDNRRLFLYVCLGVGGLALALLTVVAVSGSGDGVQEAVAEPAEAPPKPPVLNVVIPDMGAEVRTQEEAAHQLVENDTTDDPAKSAANKTPAMLAAELAGKPAEKTAEQPAEKPVEAVAPPVVVEKPVEKPVEVVAAPVEKPPVKVEKPVEKPKPVDKPAPAERAPEDPKRLFADRFDKGKKLLDQEHYEDAKKAFESALKFDPGSARAYTQLGRVNYELGNLDEALRLLRKSEALDPAHAYTYLVMGLVLQERGDGTGAERAYEKYLTLDQGSANAKAVQGFLRALRAQRNAKKG